MSEFNNDLPATRKPDSVDRQQIVPAALYLYDGDLQMWVAAALDALGGGGDTGGAREATLEAARLILLDIYAQTQAANGNSFILASQAQGTGLNVALPAGAATDAKMEAVRALLAGSLAITAAALPLPTGAATETKLEAVRALLAGTLKTNRQPTASTSISSNIPAGASTGLDMNFSGQTALQILIGTTWTTADISFEVSTNTVTWYPLYDAYGSLIVYRAAASRAVNIPVGDILNASYLRIRSGIPGAYVAQVATATVTFLVTPL